ncbi:methyl-accepting chemotaxis protein [Roseomonas stagni]|uniref:Methyl-accepting chemotaxis protein n=1 Tax=Falsiroseomonas algicola TaxID=2716930 RepID=A0A6M1LKJ0_9PROT|nr:methyl-accepting chemotaxis protein [Falsiroseomonas algicola]NGM20717.1 methyl-accepting chemotaxis protein [Falsiroseomonas algicola]
MELNAALLRTIRDRLAPAFAPVDDDLLAVGDRLGHAAGRIDGIGERFGSLRQLLDCETLEAASRQLGAAAARMTTLATQAEAENAALGELGTHLRAVGGRIAYLLRINQALGVLTLNAAIASSTLDTDSRDIVTFQTDLRRLTDLAAQTVQRFGQLHAAAVKDLAAIAAQQEAFMRQHGPKLREVSQRITRGLDSITTLRRQASAAAEQTQERGRAISAAIGAVVTALQVGDATRQRLEHVTDALGELASGLEGADRPWCHDLDPASRGALASRAMALEAALLRDAGGTLAQEMRSIADSLSRLGRETQGMVDQGQALFGRGGRDGRSFLGALDGDLGEAASLVGSSKASRDSLDAAMAAIDGHMRTLRAGLDEIRGMEIDLRVVGLNAVFRCARLGKQGAALGAVTIELRAYAKQMAEGVQGLAEALEAALAIGGRLMTAGGEAGALDDMMAAMRTGLERLGDAGRAMDAAIAGLRAEGGRVPEELAAMVECLDTALALSSAVGAMGGELDALSAAAPPPEPSLLRDRLMLVHAVPFTMEREREIARGFGADVPQAAAAAAMEVDDFLF